MNEDVVKHNIEILQKQIVALQKQAHETYGAIVTITGLLDTSKKMIDVLREEIEEMKSDNE